MTEHYYGEAPEEITFTDLDGVWTEFMHYLYLPVRIPYDDINDGGPFALPKRLEFLMPTIWRVLEDAQEQVDHLDDPYVYVTARRGYATPGNPLNRPGWHCDDFGGTDLNYTWTDAYPTRILRSDEPLDISDHDEQSMVDMQALAQRARDERTTWEVVDRNLTVGTIHPRTEPDGLPWIEEVPLNTVMRLTPYVVHDTPLIEEPGMRSFFKISVSTHRYDLIGNSHNYLLDYDWPMVSRESLRNQPSGSNRDYSGGER